MSSGFRYILVVLVAATAVFAGLSLWPSVLDALNNGTGQSGSSGQPAASPSPAPASPIGATINSPHRLQSSRTFIDERDEQPEERSWLYAQVSAELRVKPGGRGLPAASLTKAPLIILKGTRLWPVRTEGDWVMVKSPSGLLGYVHSSEVDTRIPYCKRKY